MTEQLLPVAKQWYDAEYLGDGITWVHERHVNIDTNIWLVHGAERDLLIDSGLGLGNLRGMVESLTQRPVLAAATVGYFDHAGGLNQFDERYVHRFEAHRVAVPTPRNTAVERYFSTSMLNALPFEGFAAEDYAVPASEPTRLLEEGDVIHLGDRTLEVLHLPGITDGSIGLYEVSSRSLFLGEAPVDKEPMYDGEPADYTDDADPAALRRSFERLLTLEVAKVYPGHLSPYEGRRMTQIINSYLADH